MRGCWREENPPALPPASGLWGEAACLGFFSARNEECQLLESTEINEGAAAPRPAGRSEVRRGSAHVRQE